MARPKPCAYAKDETKRALCGHVQRVMDAAYRLGLSAREVMTSAEESAVNWEAPKRGTPRGGA